MRRLISIGYAWITIGWLLFGGAPSLLIASIALLIKAMVVPFTGHTVGHFTKNRAQSLFGKSFCY
jgi:hypothetical protein